MSAAARSVVQVQVLNAAKQQVSKDVPYAVHLPRGVKADAAHDFAVVLCPAAGGKMDAGPLAALGDALAARDVPALRYECLGPHLPTRIAVTAALLRAPPPGLRGVTRWLGVGTSMGCRVCCALAADGVLQGAALLSFPLVEPASKESRAEELTATPADTPLLLVRGTRDKYTPQAEWQAARDALAAAGRKAPKVVEVEGADHSLKVPRAKQQDADALVTREVVEFVLSVQSPPAAPPLRAAGGGDAPVEEEQQPARKKAR